MTRDLFDPIWHFHLFEGYKKLCRRNKGKSICLHLLAKSSSEGNEGDDRFERVPAATGATLEYERVCWLFFSDQT